MPKMYLPLTVSLAVCREKGQHQEDLKPCKTPVFEYLRADRFNLRYLARVPFFVSGHNTFLHVSFVIITGAPGHLYLSDAASKVLKSVGKVSVVGEQEILKVGHQQKPMRLGRTPLSHAPLNILGASLLRKFGFSIDEINKVHCFHKEDGCD